MVIDDNPKNLRLLTTILKKQGYRIRPVRDGKTALNAIKSNIPDLILLDIMMPELNGYEVCRQLKENKRTRDIPIIFVTALDKVEDKLTAFSLGGVDYITKPYDENKVLARVNTHLPIQRLHREVQQERDRFHCLVEATFEGIIIHDQGIVEEVNHSAEVIRACRRNI